jgi:L-fuculose-phosphate aldolase
MEGSGKGEKMSLEWNLRKDIVEIASRLYRAGYIRGADGNLSIRLSDEKILITPSRSAKGFMKPEDMLVINIEGELLKGNLRPSSETAFHLGAYQERSDITSVIHAHPPMAVAFTVAGMDIPMGVLPELEVLFPGGIPVVPYETPGTQDLADRLRPVIREHDIAVMAHHGTIAVGEDVFDAWMKTEHLEACMEILFLAESLGGSHKLPEEKLVELEEIRRRVLQTKTRIR